MSVSEMALSLFAVNNGYFDDVPVKKVLDFEKTLTQFIQSKHSSVMSAIETTKDLSKDNESTLHAAIKEFKKSWA
jgi:F-type H+-transporting ATPase subunit alpha